MAGKKFTFLKWYTKTLKSGKIKRYAREKGRYKKWEDADTLDRPEGEFRIKEWVVHFKPTKDSRPSSIRDFEVRIKLPEGDADADDIEEMAKEIMINLTNESMVDSADIAWGKKGVDTVGYSEDDDIEWMVVDVTRPQYKYPTGKQWGKYGEDYEVE